MSDIRTRPSTKEYRDGFDSVFPPKREGVLDTVSKIVERKIAAFVARSGKVPSMAERGRMWEEALDESVGNAGEGR